MAQKKKTTKRKTGNIKRVTISENKPKRRKRAKKQSMLSEIISPTRAKATMSYIVSGALGYYTGKKLADLLTNQSPGQKALILGLASFGVANYLNLKGVGAGMTGSAIEQLLIQQRENQGLSEMLARYVDPNTMKENAPLSEYEEIETKPMFLMEDQAPLSEFDLYGGVPFEEI